jgi:two-component system, sensor histidine kinase and response regulator
MANQMLANTETFDSKAYSPAQKVTKPVATVLVVEDDSHLRSSIKDILELEAYLVLTAQHGQHALDILRNEANPTPDLIVSDIMMPFMDGIEFLKELREEARWVSIPFIFLTARTEKADRHKGLMMGVEHYLEKPFDADDLLVTVASRLRRAEDLRRAKMGEISNVKKDILTILNHEFRTPLTLVVAYAEMLKDFQSQDMKDGELLSFLKGVNSGAARLRRLIENFILLVELESGDVFKTYAWRKRPVGDLKPILMSAHGQIFDHETKHTCTFEFEDNLPEVVCDPEFIGMAARELLDNAVKFSTPEQPIMLGIKATDDNKICIWVKDQGRGIPEDEWENIWKTFYQINREKLEDQGAGSGLAIVRGIVDLHQGHKEVVSQEGEGSTISLYFPLTPPETEPDSTVAD